MRHTALAIAFFAAVSIVLAADVTDRLLETAKQGYDVVVAKADAELQKAEQRCAQTKADAKGRLVKAYEDAIKRATQRGDLESANKLLEEKKALEGGADTPAPTEPDAAAVPKVTWVPLGDDGIPPALVIKDVGAGAIESEYVDFLSKPDLSAKIHEHPVKVIKADNEGVFKGPGPKNIETNYYAIYLHTDAAQRAALALRTSEHGAIRVYVDGRQIFDHGADTKNKFETKLPLNLSRGDHVIVIRHNNGWAANWISIQIEGNRILTADFSGDQKSNDAGK